MSTVWRFEYDPGTGEEVIEFSLLEAAMLRRRLNCAMDVQRYKSGLHRVYYAPYSYYSGSFTFRMLPETYDKVVAIAALKVPIKIYYRKHVAADTFIWANIVPVTDDRFFAGWLTADDVTIQFIETKAPD